MLSRDVLRLCNFTWFVRLDCFDCRGLPFAVIFWVVLASFFRQSKLKYLPFWVLSWRAAIWCHWCWLSQRRPQGNYCSDDMILSWGTCIQTGLNRLRSYPLRLRVRYRPAWWVQESHCRVFPGFLKLACKNRQNTVVLPRWGTSYIEYRGHRRDLTAPV